MAVRIQSWTLGQPTFTLDTAIHHDNGQDGDMLETRAAGPGRRAGDSGAPPELG